MRDPYEVLGVQRNASGTEVRDAYRRLCLRYHPDKHANADEVLRELAEERFKEIRAAYEALERRGGAATLAEAPESPPPAATSRRSPAERDAWQAIDRLLQERRWAETLTAAKEAEAIHGPLLWVLAAKATAYEQLGMLSRAAEAAGVASSLFPDDGDVAAEHGRLLIKTEEWKKAIGELQRARRILGDLPDLLALNGLAYEHLGFLTNADALFEQVDRIDPSNEYLAHRDEAAGIKRGRYFGGPAGRTIGCGGLVTLLLFVVWLIVKSLR